MSFLLKYGFTKPSQTANTILTEERRNTKGNYEEIIQKIRSEWKKEFKWREYDISNDIMTTR